MTQTLKAAKRHRIPILQPDNRAIYVSVIQWKYFTSCWNSRHDQFRIRPGTVLSKLLGYLPQKLRDTNCLLSCTLLPAQSLQVPAWGSAGGTLASQEIKEHKHKGMRCFDNRNVKHSSTPNHSLSHLPHDLPPAEGDSRKGTQKIETLLPNLLPSSVMIPITDAKCHWLRDILGATKWIVMFATFSSLGLALWRLKSSKYTGNKNTRRTAGDT